ncbi:OTU domain-containing protein 4-like isoform X2 [Megalobrama amblycephala]|uniref:OTU domain-containing protein 4-like isoform X2 n=1 Tax=Megalobrama amblycephala TaxID=75352 RepID=UPI0020145D55|nr:OTU domain-containing protein 4-like isoform X2 [Megalobrama amblycephala]
MPQPVCNVSSSKGKMGRRKKQDGVLVHAGDEDSHLLEADGSSFPCSSGKALYSEVLKSTHKVCKSVTTEVRSSEFEVPEAASASTDFSMPQPVCNVLPSKGKMGRREKQDGQVTEKWVENVVADDIIIDVSIPEVYFSPLTHKDQQALCELVLLTNDGNSDCDGITHFGPIAGPCQTKSIKPDGNCFFRSLAYAICGSEDKHLKIRRAVVKHLKMNTSIFQRYVRSEYTSVEDYLTQSRIFYSGSWATEIDIFAASNLFNTTIMTFNDDRWNAHKPTEEVITNKVIYLKHCNGNHYEVVTCVKHRDQDVCAGTCGNVTLNEVRKPCLRKRKVCDAAESSTTKSDRDRYFNDSEYRQKKLKYFKSKYGIDTDYRGKKLKKLYEKYHRSGEVKVSKCESSKNKYSSNIEFQKRVCQYSQMKYKNNVSFQGSVWEYSKKKYLQNLAFKKRLCEYTKMKYLHDPAFKAKK